MYDNFGEGAYVGQALFAPLSCCCTRQILPNSRLGRLADRNARASHLEARREKDVENGMRTALSNFTNVTKIERWMWREDQYVRAASADCKKSDCVSKAKRSYMSHREEVVDKKKHGTTTRTSVKHFRRRIRRTK